MFESRNTARDYRIGSEMYDRKDLSLHTIRVARRLRTIANKDGNNADGCL